MRIAFFPLYLFLALGLFGSQTSFAQNKPKQKPKSNNSAPAPEVVEEFKDIRVEAPSSERFNSGSGYSDNSRFATERLDDNWTIVRDRLSNDYSVGLAKNGTMVLPPIFRINSSYSNTMKEQKKIILSIENNFGVFDYGKGRWHIPMSYQNLVMLDNNLLIAKRGDRFGVIDFENKTIVNFDWNSINSINEGNYVIVRNNQEQHGILNLVTGKLTTPCIYKHLAKVDNGGGFMVTNFAGQKSIVSLNNEPILKNWYDEIHPVHKRRNMIVRKNAKYGIIDDQEKIIVPLEYNLIKTYPFNDGSYLAQNALGKYGCLAIDGRATLPFDYDQLNEASGQSMLISTKDKKCGIVQVNQGLPTEILTCDYDDIRVNRQTFVVSKGGKYGLLDNYGKSISEIEYDMITPVNDRDYQQNSLFIAQKGQRYLVLGSLGQKISDKTYKSISKLQESSTDYYSSKVQGLRFEADNGKVGVLDVFGQELIAPLYDDVESITKSFIIFKKGKSFGMYNYINKKEIAAPIYDQIIFTKKGYLGTKGIDFYALDLTDPAKHVKIK